MITALDHVRIEAPDVGAAIGAMERLLARSASVTASAGRQEAVFRLDNMTIEVARGDVEGIAGLAFEIGDADAAFRTLERRALAPRGPTAFAEADKAGALARQGRRIELSSEATFGPRLSLIESDRGQSASPKSSATAEGAVTGLDHIVIRTTHPNRAAALYGARLGLDMRLDRTEPKWGARLMFFRCGDLIVEVVHNLKDEPSDAPDQLWGLSWRVANADIAHARLKANGFDVSEVRAGRKPGTRVFTVRTETLGIPTLFVEPATR